MHGLLCLALVLPILATPASASSGASDAPAGLWRDASDEVGLRFHHENGASDEWYFPEIMGAGAALFDYDGDGDLDLYLVQGAPLGDVDPDRGPEPRDRLLRNDLENGRVRLVDVTEQAGIDARGYGMAVTAADFDNDGWIDLYVGNYGANQLWRNRGPDARGRVTFEDVTDDWRADDRRWTAALAPFDFDADGDLDLFVGNYLRFELARHKTCAGPSGLRDYCHPSSYPSEPDLLLRNTASEDRPGFVDVSRRALRDAVPGSALGASVLDADDDGRLDLYVANDDQPNHLWRNEGPSVDGTFTFTDQALLTGSAVNGRGLPEGSMGLAVGDVDLDGDADLFSTHLKGQTHTLYVRDGGIFHDQTRVRGLGAPSLPFTGFGTAFVDGDLDGDLDLVVVNGGVQVIEEQRRRGDAHPFHQPHQYFKNDGRGHFTEATAEAGDAFAVSEVSRGLALGDVDNDGAPDLLITQNRGPARLLLHRGPGKKPWLGLRIVADGRDSLGARVRITRRGAPDLVHRVGVDGSYASSRDPRVLVHPNAPVEGIEILWLDGERELFDPPPVGRYSTLVRGTGRAPSDDRAPEPEPSPRNP